MDASERADRMIRKGKPDNALNYLNLTKRAQRANEKLQQTLDNSSPNCHDNPGPYMDYPENRPPSAERAYELCKGCPVLADCARFASAYRPPMGVWGGEVYVDGKPVSK